MIYRSEIYRAIHNRKFLISLVVALLIVLVHQVAFVIPVNRGLHWDIGDPTVQPNSLYNKWIGLLYTYTCIAFYWMIPILAALPFAGSYFTDRKSGYMKNLLLRTDKRKYLRAKVLAVFVSSSILVSVPLLADLLFTAAFLPALTPLPTNGMFPLLDGFMWSKLFYHTPLVYVLLYIFLNTVFISVSILISLTLTGVFKYSLEAVLIPFIIYLFSYYVLAWLGYAQLAPLIFLIPLQPAWNISLGPILAELMIAIVAVYFFYYRRGLKKDISL